MSGTRLPLILSTAVTAQALVMADEIEGCAIIGSMRAIRTDTILAMHERGHELAACCPKCLRWAELDLKKLIAGRRGDYKCWSDSQGGP